MERLDRTPGFIVDQDECVAAAHSVAQQLRRGVAQMAAGNRHLNREDLHGTRAAELGELSDAYGLAP